MNFRHWWLPRRLSQIAVLFLLVSPLLGFSFFQGNLASASLFGFQLSEPLAALQILLASGIAVPAYVGSALLVAAIYFLLGGRTFCAWVCPVYLLGDLTDLLRPRGERETRTFSLAHKEKLLLLTLAGTWMTGIPLFEFISPIGAFNRALVFGSWSALLLLAGLLLMEVGFSRRLWCRSLCPAGSFYALLGRHSPTRVRFSARRCDGCGDCLKVCPVEEVLLTPLGHNGSSISSGDCTRCGRCVDCCTRSALRLGIGYTSKNE